MHVESSSDCSKDSLTAGRVPTEDYGLERHLFCWYTTLVDKVSVLMVSGDELFDIKDETGQLALEALIANQAKW